MLDLLIVSVPEQLLYGFKGAQEQCCYRVSTGQAGLGEQEGSGQTPRGRHCVRAKIGGGAPLGTVFVSRRPTGEVFSESLARQYPRRDWVLTRILWLSGLETGFNRGGSVDTMRRYIYIHGCPDCIVFDGPGSHGCVRMRNQDVVSLYDRVPLGTQVIIHEGKNSHT